MYGKYQGKKALVHWYSSEITAGDTKWVEHEINFQVAMEVTSSERYDLVVNTLELPRCNCVQVISGHCVMDELLPVWAELK